MKRKGFKLLALAVITACCFGISAASAFAADGETKTAMNGASIRTIEPTGLRFEAVVDKTTYESVTAENSGKSFGAFILPKDYLTAANITEITNHKNQFTAVEKYLEKEDVAGEMKGSDYVLKYSIADLHYYNYNRDFVGMFFIKTVGADNTVSYQYFTVNAKNNERSVAFVAKAAIENASEVPDAAYNFAIAAKYLEANPCNSAEEEPTKKKEAETFVTANKEGFKTAYTAIKTAADIESISLTDEAKITAARTAYDNAEETVIKKLLADCSVYKKFIDNESKYKDLVNSGAVDQVVTLINNLPEYNESTVVPVIYNKNYKTVKAAYDNLTDEQKPQITNYNKLKKYEDAAKNVKSLYTSIDNFTSSVTVVAEGAGSTPGTDDDYGDVYKIRGQNNGNVYLKFNSYADLTGYDVVRFPIFMSGETNQNSLHKYSTDSDLVGYHTLLTPGWNIITVPVSFMMNGFVLGGSVLPGMTWLHYAIPYMEKLGNGSKLSIGDLSASLYNDDSYGATVSFAKEQDPNEGRVLKVITAEKQGSNYAFKINNFKEYQKIVAESGATGVKFKIKNLEGGVRLYMPHAESGHDADNCLKEIKMVKNEWVEVSLTAEEFARWKDGFFRCTWGAGSKYLMTDFTIVK